MAAVVPPYGIPCLFTAPGHYWDARHKGVLARSQGLHSQSQISSHARDYASHEMHSTRIDRVYVPMQILGRYCSPNIVKLLGYASDQVMPRDCEHCHNAIISDGTCLQPMQTVWDAHLSTGLMSFE